MKKMQQMNAMDFIRKNVPAEYRKRFIDEGRKWDYTFSVRAYYDIDLLKTFLDYAKEY